jgi:hypothetical protein
MRSARNSKARVTRSRSISCLQLGCRLHKTHRMTPAMATGLTDKLLDMSDIVKLIDLAVDRHRQEAISSQARAFLSSSSLRVARSIWASSNSTASLVQWCAKSTKVLRTSDVVAASASAMQFTACMRHSLGSPGIVVAPFEVQELAPFSGNCELTVTVFRPIQTEVMSQFE